MWTYRVAHVKGRTFEWHDIREYYPKVQGEDLWTTESTEPIGETVDGLIRDLELMLKAAKKAKDDPSLILELDEHGDRRKEAGDESA